MRSDIGDRVNESEAEGPSNYETISPSLVRANLVLKQRDALAMLCGEMLATLKNPRNQGESIARLCETVMSGWEQEFRKHSGEVDCPEKRYREEREQWRGHAEAAWADRNALDAAITQFQKDGDFAALRRVQEQIPCGG